jgi:hypothetical protein
MQAYNKFAMTNLQVPVKSITYVRGSWRACCMADAYFGVTMNFIKKRLALEEESIYAMTRLQVPAKSIT